MENKNMMDLELENVAGGAFYGDNYYIVKKGDTLRKLANRYYGEPNEWRRIAKANKIKDPTKLKVGRKLRTPPDDKKD